MSKLVYRYLIIIMLAFSWIVGNAQVKQPEYKELTPSVSIIARSKGDSVMIRWAPDDPLLWKLSNKYGYKLVRITVARDSSLLFGNNRIITVLADSMKPYPLNQIEPVAEKDDYAAIVAQAIYGEDFQLSTGFQNGPAQVLNKAKEMEDRFSFALFSADQSPMAAHVHGLWFTDHHVIKGEKYLYEVFPLVPAGIISFDTAYTVVAVDDTTPLPKPYNFNAVWGDKNVELSWNREYMQKFYTSYIIERSEDNGVTFARTNQSPFLNLSPTEKELSENYYKVDSLPSNNVPYLYRIRGISPFGETGPPSDVAAGMGMSKSDFLNPIIVKNEVRNNSMAYLEWEVMEQYAEDIAGFEIQKSGKSEGPYITVNSAQLDRLTRSFIDVEPYKTGYYRIGSIDCYGEKHYSFPAMVLMPDSIPPATPLDFEGKVDSTGIVTLTWKSNTEEDLAGYRIYQSNYKEDGYVKINNEQITVNRFADTISLRVLTKKIYYRLGAIDNHYNESVLTTALVIIRPDTIKPASPVFKDYVVNDSAIVISWINSPSQDINDHALYRRKIGENKWMRINMAGDTTGIYTDTDIVNQTIYQYIIIASDLGGLESEPINTLDIRYGGQAKSNNTNIELKAAADPSGKAILINWHTGPDIEKYALYRSVDDGPLVLYFTLNGAEKSFNDKNVRIGHSYRYRIQIVAKDGLRSPLSDEIKVQF